MEVVLGVDGGGTKTAAVVMDVAQRVLGRGMGPSSNHHDVGTEAAAAALRQAIKGALSEAGAGFNDVVGICLCLAGADRPADQERMAGLVRAIYPFPRVAVYNDAVGALAAGTGRLLGVVVIAGTGTIAYGFDRQGRSARAAGWGALLADYGSGFWIGMEALHAIVRAADGRGPTTALTERVLAHLGLADAEGLISWTYGEPFHWHRFAALAPIVTKTAQAGDGVAQDILRRAGRHLAESGLAVMRRLQMQDEPFDLVLSGSVWQAGEWVLAPFREAVLAEAPQTRIVFPSRTAAEGAALLAWQEAWHGHG
ncbi:MAG: BadF/BadG/BcrA/BcrD ATPase family protein [Anaerolineae bacterium]|nr:ATPase [Anaerolineae bacterium]MDW8100373.1 BadF/BadG/BcrA/BcrD ATPase family protein [Anaerolineae bacterium]